MERQRAMGDAEDCRGIEKTLRELVERFDLMVRGSKVGLWDAPVTLDDPFNPENECYYSDRLKEMLGYAPDQMPHKLGSFWRHVHPDDSERLYSELTAHLRHAVPYDLEYRIVTRSGETRWMHARGDSLRDAEGRPTRISGSLTDVTARKLYEERLRQEQDFLRGLLKTHERERQLIAYEIHDGLVQDIVGCLWRLDSIAANQLADGPHDRENFDVAMQLLRRALVEARRVLNGLRPPILDEQGIVMAIDHLVAEQSDDGLKIVFQHDVRFERLDALLESTLFRIVQEALTNIRRHSHSSGAELKLVESGDALSLVVRDWGVGFDVDLVPPERFGLRGIRKRVALVGGTIDIESRLGAGTRIAVQLPLASPTVEST